MRQEIKFCANVYRLLWDHIGDPEAAYFCLDGAAAEKGIREGLLSDLWVPDFHFRFKKGLIPFSLKAKVVRDGKVTFCGDGQPSAWCRGGTGAHPPVLWIGIDEDTPTVYMWEHTAFDQVLRGFAGRGKTAGGTKKTLRAALPQDAQLFSGISELVSQIVQYAKQHGYYP